MGELLIGLQVKDEMLQPTFNKSRLWNYSHLRCKEQKCIRPQWDAPDLFNSNVETKRDVKKMWLKNWQTLDPMNFYKVQIMQCWCFNL